MGTTVRNPRIESPIGFPKLLEALFSAGEFPSPRLSEPLPPGTEFWVQRLEAKNLPERPLLSAETGNVENRRQDPRRNGLFSIDDGFRGSGRLGGGVRSHMRTGLVWTFA